MTQEIHLPFEVGQTIEVKSFEHGYRGAWFRCEILNMTNEKTGLHYSLKYLDFHEEPLHNTQVIQKFQKEKCIMVRPAYPPHFHESEELRIQSAVEPLIVTHTSWEVGDLVDWWTDDCFWSGTILELKEEGKVQVELFPEPFGEGMTYEALCSDLRPLLDWSPDDGWKLPSVEGQRRQCAQLVKRINEGVCESREEHTNRVMTEPSQENEKLQLNIMMSDSLEAPISDLEELILRLQWIKEKLIEDSGESWRYEGYCPSYSGVQLQNGIPKETEEEETAGNLLKGLNIGKE